VYPSLTSWVHRPRCPMSALLICTPEGIAVASAVSEKRCARCRVEKPRELFNREQRKRDGLSAWCKACKSIDQSRRRRELLVHDEDWRIRRRTFAMLARLLQKGALAKPEACPACNKVVPAREMQARFGVAADPFTVLWRCRACALFEQGKSVKRVCAWCDEPFQAQTHQLRRGAGRYCSVRCRNAWMRGTAEHVKDTLQRTKAVSVYVDDRF
jgi:hypothetical protein